MRTFITSALILNLSLATDLHGGSWKRKDASVKHAEAMSLLEADKTSTDYHYADMGSLFKQMNKWSLKYWGDSAPEQDWKATYGGETHIR